MVQIHYLRRGFFNLLRGLRRLEEIAVCGGRTFQKFLQTGEKEEGLDGPRFLKKHDGQCVIEQSLIQVESTSNMLYVFFIHLESISSIRFRGFYL